MEEGDLWEIQQDVKALLAGLARLEERVEFWCDEKIGPRVTSLERKGDVHEDRLNEQRRWGFILAVALAGLACDVILRLMF
ncbi:MAG: hypothetical protein SVS15_08010 [Thermodesulfobacteriota bacterium]|nr:hypothetical protein [Thermodesulfobacteriota bacterium]